MRILLHLLTELSRPARQELGGSRVYLKSFVILTIAVVVGSDLFAFVELTTVLELLGAAMFVVAFAAGYRLIAAGALDGLRRLLLPAEYAWLLKIRGHPAAIVCGTMFAARNALVLALLGFMAYAGVAILAGIAA
jgi:hypothetical protein